MEITWIHVATESLLFCLFPLHREIAMWVAPTKALEIFLQIKLTKSYFDGEFQNLLGLDKKQIKVISHSKFMAPIKSKT